MLHIVNIMRPAFHRMQDCYKTINKRAQEDHYTKILASLGSKRNINIAIHSIQNWQQYLEPDQLNSNSSSTNRNTNNDAYTQQQQPRQLKYDDSDNDNDKVFCPENSQGSKYAYIVNNRFVSCD